jgi:glutamate transport system permease protein
VMRGMIEFSPSLLYAIFVLIALCFVVLTLPMGLLFTHLSRRLVVQR